MDVWISLMYYFHSVRYGFPHGSHPIPTTLLIHHENLHYLIDGKCFLGHFSLTILLYRQASRLQFIALSHA